MNETRSHVFTSRAVSRAVARSRAVRASVARRRRRKAGLVACLATVVGAPIVWTIAEPARVVAAAAVSEAQDLADLLSQRSPGNRTQAELTKHARAMSKARTRPAAPAEQPKLHATDALVDLLQPGVAPVTLTVEPPPALAPPPTLGTVLAAANLPPSSPPTDGGPVHLPTAQPRELPPTSAVPEPGTWALMLMGFGLIAWRVRRRRPAFQACAATRVAK